METEKSEGLPTVRAWPVQYHLVAHLNSMLLCRLASFHHCYHFNHFCYGHKDTGRRKNVKVDMSLKIFLDDGIDQLD
jgi:hypothetical protein